MVKWQSLSHVSAYKRADSHLTRQTAHGAIVTILGVILGITLTVHETSWYFMGKGTSKMNVDLARRHDLNIHVDITFPAIPCAGLSVDFMDASGSSGNDASHAKDVHLHKMRLDQHGRRIGGKGGEYMTPQSQKMVRDKSGTVMQIDLGAAMTQMSDMDEEIKQHEGCRVYGEVSVRRVAGRLHFAVHQQSFIDVLPQMLTGHVLPKLTNISHIIHKVAFGPEYPGQVNPLDGFNRIQGLDEAPKAYKYFLKIVPTEYTTRMGVLLETSQYSISEYAMPLRSNGNPPQPHHPHKAEPPKDGQHHKVAEATGAEPSGGSAAGPAGGQATNAVQNAFVDFSYDLSPIIMTINQSPGSLLHFLVRMCAVIGGVLSVTRMADKLVHAILVGMGVVVIDKGGIKGRHSSAGSGSFGGSYPGSARNSLPGDAAAYVSGGRASFGGGSYPIRTSSGGGLIPDANLHQRLHGSHPGSHPLSRLNSSGSTMSGVSGGGALLQGAHSYGGAAPIASTGSGQLHSMNSVGTMNGYGSNMGSAGTGSAPGSGSGSTHLVGDAIPVAPGSGGSGAVRTSYSGPSSGGVMPAPAAAGQVSHLLSDYGARSAPVPGGRAFSGGGAMPQQQQQQQGVPASRLAAAAGPGQFGGPFVAKRD